MSDELFYCFIVIEVISDLNEEFHIKDSKQTNNLNFCLHQHESKFIFSP